MKKTFLSLALLMMPVLYAGQNYQDEADSVFCPTPIIQQKNIHVPEHYTLVYANPYDPEKYIYSTSIIKCEKLTGKGTIFVDNHNTLIIHATDLSKFTGHFYCSQSALFIIYTYTKNKDFKFSLWRNQQLNNQK